MVVMEHGKKRCPWVNLANPLYVEYHDREWGRAVHDDVRHFEMLTLEGAQAGLSRETILKKRDGYRDAFAGFDPVKVARFSRSRIGKILADPGVVRNRLKIESTVTNAAAFIAVQKEFGSFDRYVWAFVSGKPLRSAFRAVADYPARDQRERRAVEGPEEARFPLRRLDDHLRVHAGRGSRG
jgi:DNA-3-methyladenine glycosylase I